MATDKKVFNRIIALLFLLIPALFCFFADPSAAYAKIFKKNAVIMGTDLEITVSTEDELKAEQAFNAVINEFTRIDDEMSEWREGTYISAINKNSGKEATKVPDEVFNVIAAAQQVSALSGGAFDISWAAMRGVWNFTPGHERVPTPEEAGKLRPLINYKEIELDSRNKTVFLKKKGMAIGLGAIAKGYAVDRGMQALVSSGIKDAIIRAGGDMRVQGLENGKPWDIGIHHPRERNGLLAKLALTNISISTSGDYERFFIKDGVLYHHILDPKTGYPALKCRSVTILAPDTMTSDAISTAVFVLGPAEGMRLVKSLKGVEAIIVDSSGATHTSAGIELR